MDNFTGLASVFPILDWRVTLFTRKTTGTPLCDQRQRRAQKCATLAALGSDWTGLCSRRGKCLSLYEAAFTHMLAVVVFPSSWFSGRRASRMRVRLEPFFILSFLGHVRLSDPRSTPALPLGTWLYAHQGRKHLTTRLNSCVEVRQSGE